MSIFFCIYNSTVLHDSCLLIIIIVCHLRSGLTTTVLYIVLCAKCNSSCLHSIRVYHCMCVLRNAQHSQRLVAMELVRLLSICPSLYTAVNRDPGACAFFLPPFTHQFLVSSFRMKCLKQWLTFFLKYTSA